MAARQDQTVMAEQATETSHVSRIVKWWVFLFALYWLLVGQNTLAQLGAAVILGFISMALVLTLGQVTGLQYPIEAKWWGLLLRVLPLSILADSGRVLLSVFRAAPGEDEDGTFCTVKAPLAGDAAIDKSRRAFLITAVSAAPNTVVTFADAERNRLLLHQSVPHPVPAHLVDGEEWPI